RRHLLVQLLLGGRRIINKSILLEKGDADQLVEHPAVDVRGQGDGLASLGQLHLNHLRALEEVVFLDRLTVHLGHHVGHLVRRHRRGGWVGRRIQVEGGGARGGRLPRLARLPRGGRRGGGGRSGRRLRLLVSRFTGSPGGEQQGEPQDKEHRAGHGLLVHFGFLERRRAGGPPPNVSGEV